MRIGSMLICCAIVACGCAHQASVMQVSQSARSDEVRMFVGTWIAEDAKFADGTVHRLEIDINADGTFRGVYTDLSPNVSPAHGTWTRTSPMAAIGIFSEPSEAILLYVSTDDRLTMTSRQQQVRLHRDVATHDTVTR